MAQVKKTDVNYEQLESSPAESSDVKRFVGFLRTDLRKGFVTLFNSMEFNNALEIPEDDIVKKKLLPSEDEELPMTAVWVRRKAELLRTHRISITRESEFLQGALLAEFVGNSRAARPTPGGTGANIAVDLYLAKSETTLTCWEECTVYISNCLTN